MDLNLELLKKILIFNKILLLQMVCSVAIFFYFILDINWNAIEMVIRYGIENIHFGSALPSEYPLLLAENYFNTPQRKEKVTEERYS